MSFRCLLRPRSVLVVTAVVLMASAAWAHWYELGSSNNEWGLKYSGEVTAGRNGMLNVQFTLADQGRLGPIHSVFVMALSNPDRNGSRTYLLKTPVSMQPTGDGGLTGQVEVRQELANRAVVRIFTMNVDGRSQMTGPTAGARYYDIPLRTLVKKSP